METDMFEDDETHLTRRRNTWSFESRWVSKFKHAGNMDLADDHDSWSVVSHDSAGSAEMDTNPYYPSSLPGIPRRSSLKDLAKLGDSMHSLDHSLSPQSTPGLSRKITTSTDNSALDSTTDLKDKSKSGLSNSMILNWLSFKKYPQYPTIVESPESPRGSPVDESSMDSGITVIAGPGQTQPANPTVRASGKILEAATPFTPNANTLSPPVANAGLRRNFSLNEMGTASEENQGIRRNFSFKELNAVAPSCW